MKSSELRGTGSVFRFTLIQTIKSKAYIISLIFMLVMALFANPILQLVNSGNKDEKTTVQSTEIKKAYVCNEIESFPLTEKELFAAFTDMSKEAVFSKVEFVAATESYDDVCDRLKNESGESENVVIKTTMGAGDSGVTFNIEVARVDGSDVSKDECLSLADALCANLDQLKQDLSGLSEAELKILAYEYEVEMNYVTPDGELTADEDKGITGTQFGIAYVIMFVVGMLCIMASTQVATAVVTDKSSRVVELLLTSVRPMALLLGKILAMLIASVGQMALTVAAFAASNKLTEILFNTEKTFLAGKIPADIWNNLTFVNIVIAFALIALGLVFYATFAGLCGAMVSKMEELSDALKYFTFLSIIGMYAAIAAIISMQKSADNIFVKFCEMFPLTSSMTTPGARIIGVVPISTALIAIALLIVVDYLVLLFAARIYEGLITNMGTRVKFKDLFKMAGSKRKGGAK